MTEPTTRACIACRKIAPKTQTPHTLITKYGWRATRPSSVTGRARVEWWCPDCWRRKRNAGAAGEGEGER
jgi:hypothetical protein